jgi:hypothetical protein
MSTERDMDRTSSDDRNGDTVSDRRKLVCIDVGRYHFEIRSVTGGLIFLMLVMSVMGAGAYYLDHQETNVSFADHVRSFSIHDVEMRERHNALDDRLQQLVWITCVSHKSQDYCSSLGVYMPSSMLLPRIPRQPGRP